MEIQEQVPLAPLTTLGIGGPAKWFVEATQESDIFEAVLWARERQVPLFVLGGGSNLLVADQGFSGLVVHMALRGIDRDGSLYRSKAGESWDAFVEKTVSDNCAGIECLAGIPGTVGGTPVQNVGAYGQEVSETVELVRVFDLANLQFKELRAADCGFAYRASIFNSTHRGKSIVTRVDYRLRPDGPANLNYADLQRVFRSDAHPSLIEVASAVREIRKSKGMVLVDGDPDCRSAGSFFKNPIIPVSQFVALQTRMGIEIPRYLATEGNVKLPAAWLIEQAGFAKGFKLGRVGISSRHTLALVNLGNATAVDLLALRDLIGSKIRNKFNIHLQMEPVLLGF